MDEVVPLRNQVVERAAATALGHQVAGVAERDPQSMQRAPAS